MLPTAIGMTPGRILLWRHFRLYHPFPTWTFLPVTSCSEISSSKIRPTSGAGSGPRRFSAQLFLLVLFPPLSMFNESRIPMVISSTFLWTVMEGSSRRHPSLRAMIAIRFPSMSAKSVLGCDWVATSRRFILVPSLVWHVRAARLSVGYADMVGLRQFVNHRPTARTPFRLQLQWIQLRAAFVCHDFQVCAAYRPWWICSFSSRNKLAFTRIDRPLDHGWSMALSSTWLDHPDFDMSLREVHTDPRACVLLGW